MFYLKSLCKYVFKVLQEQINNIIYVIQYTDYDYVYKENIIYEPVSIKQFEPKRINLITDHNY